ENCSPAFDAPGRRVEAQECDLPALTVAAPRQPAHVHRALRFSSVPSPTGPLELVPRNLTPAVHRQGDVRKHPALTAMTLFSPTH
ncbi:hypothetical protein, partial [Candidatus Amarolinea dominans]|uniref:hypothetical protein n=1 Tax=Candidatus Amarolinea dominans TaxID=3140696 RepID=UPI0031CC3CD9